MLRARDQVLLATLTSGNGRLIDVEDAIEAMALSAMGAFDIVARAANMAIPLDLRPQQCGFRKREFRSALRRLAPRAGQAADEPTATDTIDLVAGLRNTIHAEPLRRSGYGGPGSRTNEVRVLVPADTADSVWECSQRLGKADLWLKDFRFGELEDIGISGVLVHPPRLANDLVSIVAAAVNALVAPVPWPRDPSSQGWGHQRADDPAAPENARRIQWLYGFSAE
jgi:hypothetical protein